MRFLFVADPIESFKIHKDTTFVMMREAQARGHEIWVCEPQDLSWQQGQRVTAMARRIRLTDEAQGQSKSQVSWFEAEAAQPQALADFDAVLMRKDPPFDMEFFYTTHLLTQAEREGARVLNSPKALREHPEKLAILEFPEWIGPTLVTRDEKAIRAFHAEHKDIILKPLDGMGGMGIFRVGPDGMNLGSIIETLNQEGATSVMVQRYLPEIVDGDKRVLLIGGKPVPYCLARIPQGGEVRGNLAAGGRGEARPLTERDRQIGEALGPVLMARGLLLVGVDVIGSCVTEINVTSPTCFQEIQQQTGCNVAALYIDALELFLQTASNEA